MHGSPAPVNTVAQLLRPGTTPRAIEVDPDAREHAAAVVAHLLHRDCNQWSWTEHHADVHRGEASRIVGALVREGWSPS